MAISARCRHLLQRSRRSTRSAYSAAGKGGRQGGQKFGCHRDGLQGAMQRSCGRRLVSWSLTLVSTAEPPKLSFNCNWKGSDCTGVRTSGINLQGQAGLEQLVQHAIGQGQHLPRRGGSTGYGLRRAHDVTYASHAARHRHMAAASGRCRPESGLRGGNRRVIQGNWPALPKATESLPGRCCPQSATCRAPPPHGWWQSAGQERVAATVDGPAPRHRCSSGSTSTELCSGGGQVAIQPHASLATPGSLKQPQMRTAQRSNFLIRRSSSSPSRGCTGRRCRRGKEKAGGGRRLGTMQWGRHTAAAVRSHAQAAQGQAASGTV